MSISDLVNKGGTMPLSFLILNLNFMYLKIIAQYQENYGYYEGKESWKNKGGDEFIFTPKDLDYFYEDKDMDVKIAERYLQSISNKACRYLLIECSRECGNVIDISDECEKIYDDLVNERSSQKINSHA
jgi:hypothetical protein